MKKTEKRTDVSPSPPACCCLFQCKQQGTTIWKEILAGFTTFLILSFSYYQSSILLVNSLQISGEHIPSLIVVMLISVAIMSIFAGFYLKRPIVYGISTGMTVFLTASIFSTYNMNISSGFGLLFIEGVIFLLLAFTGLPRWIINHTPQWIQKGSPAIIGSMLLLYAVVSSGIVSFDSNSTFVAQTLRTPSILLFLFGFVVALTLYYLKIKNAFLLAFFITLLFGFVLSKNPANSTFRVSWLLLIGYIAAWLMLFSILFDKNVKYALEKSLWILIGGLLVGVILYNNPHSIFLKPQQLIGTQGLFALPSFSVLPIFVGSSVETIGILFREIGLFWAPLLSLLLFHFFLYVCMFYTTESFVPTMQDSTTNETLFSKMMITEGIGSLLAGNSAIAPIHSSTATPIHVAVGGKTGASSVAYGFITLLSLFAVPLLRFVMLPIVIAPFFFSLGVIFIVHALQSFESLSLAKIVPLIASVILAIITFDIVLSLFIGLLLYAILATYEKKSVSFGFWMVIIALFVFEFFRIVIPYFSM
jgi:xanthine/uracil/vitamin C permease (AzgA family)